VRPRTGLCGALDLGAAINADDRQHAVDVRTRLLLHAEAVEKSNGVQQNCSNKLKIRKNGLPENR
jgi:hypothetical protein